MASLDAFRVRLVGLRAQSLVPPAVAAILVGLFLAQGAWFITANSPTHDEAMHLASGYSYLATHDFRLNPPNPPLIKELLALPVYLRYRLPFNPNPQYWASGSDFFIGQDFLYLSPIPANRILTLSRVANLVLGACLVMLVGWWAFRLWGGRAAVLATALASLEPNLVAHASLATTDIGVSLFVVLSVYLLWEHLSAPRRWWLLVATGVSTGLACTSKYSAILLIPAMAVIVVLDLLLVEPHEAVPPVGSARRERRRELVQRGAALLVILVVAALTIPSAYFFQGAQHWLSGLRSFLTLSQAGQPAFFWGNYSYQGWWDYFLVAFLIKTPLGSLILIAASLVFGLAAGPPSRRHVLVLLTPVAIMFLAMTVAKVNIGLRHILPVYPFLFVLASRLATVHFSRRWLAPALVFLAVVFTAVSALRIAPHQLAYFNEAVGGPDEGYRYLADSNLDWGQDLRGVKVFMEKEQLPMIYLSYFGSAPPSYFGIRYEYVPGTWPLEWPPPSDRVRATAPRKMLAISVQNLLDVSRSDDPLFRWLAGRRVFGKIGYSIFVYDLTNDADALAKLEETAVKAGIRDDRKH